MNQSHLMAWLLVGLLTGCDQPPKPTAELTCKDSPTGRSKAEQTLIADACFRQGNFKKSSGMEW
ncbi:entry exclusion lipoprotein TrbK [Legionella rowbothamii]|uniref:entry exclusion lipoprotein TrbK n=1 Tax=Legionella rowbothamii TaxID=96229 RepID=UPI001055A317|nr:entry exclusion lipoprotein TrbK [Legionella rowbothamii]